MVEPEQADVLADAPIVEPEPEDPHAGRGFFFLALLIALVALLAYRVYPSTHPLQKNPNFIDVIFGNNLVLFAARLVLLSAGVVLAVAAVFVVISFWKRAKAGHWMAEFGPLKTQALENLEGVLAQWQTWWQEEFTARQELEGRVAESDQLLAELNEHYQAALLEIERLREGQVDEDQG